MNRLEEIININLNGLASVMDKEAHLFYKDVIALCMEQYAKECIEASLSKASKNVEYTVEEHLGDEIDWVVDESSITDSNNIVLL